MSKEKLEVLKNPNATGAQRLELGKFVVLSIPSSHTSTILGENALTSDFVSALQKVDNTEVLMDSEGVRITADAEEFRKLAWQAGMPMESLRVAFSKASEEITQYEQSKNIPYKLFRSWFTRFGVVKKAAANVNDDPNVTLTIKKYGY